MQHFLHTVNSFDALLKRYSQSEIDVKETHATSVITTFVVDFVCALTFAICPSPNQLRTCKSYAYNLGLCGGGLDVNDVVHACSLLYIKQEI